MAYRRQRKDGKAAACAEEGDEDAADRSEEIEHLARSAAIDSRVASSERRQDLIADRLRGERGVVNAIPIIEQIGISARLSGEGIDAGHVDGQEVHGNPSDDRRWFSSNAHNTPMTRRPQP